jgi:hypothetical protein
MKYRKLRIAWSIGWGVLCLLLVVLWVRSYYTAGRSMIVRSPIWTATVYMAAGRMIAVATTSVVQAKPLGVWSYSDGRTRVSDPPFDFIIYPESGFAAFQLTNAFVIQIPSWFSLAAVAILSALP